MWTKKYLCFISIIVLYSCGQKTGKQIENLELVKLTSKIVPLVNYADNADSCKRAVEILDSATTIDSSCFLCYYNKLMFLKSLKLYDEAAIAINNCLRLSPNSHDLYLTGGIIYEKAGDTITANNYFQKSLGICNAVLDTMNIANSNYGMIARNKAINLIMLGESRQAKDLLIKLSAEQTNSDQKKNIMTLLDKTKKQLVEDMAK